MKTIIRISIAMMLLLFITPKGYCSDPEELLGVSLNFDKKEITITVVTGGCTEKNDFQFVMKNGALTILRKKKDTCKMLQTKISFTYSLKEAGIDPNKPFKIMNKFSANAFFANIR